MEILDRKQPSPPVSPQNIMVNTRVTPYVPPFERDNSRTVLQSVSYLLGLMAPCLLTERRAIAGRAGGCGLYASPRDSMTRRCNFDC